MRPLPARAPVPWRLGAPRRPGAHRASSGSSRGRSASPAAPSTGCGRKCAPCIILPTENSPPRARAPTRARRARRRLRSRRRKYSAKKVKPLLAWPPGQQRPGLAVGARSASSGCGLHAAIAGQVPGAVHGGQRLQGRHDRGGQAHRQDQIAEAPAQAVPGAIQATGDEPGQGQQRHRDHRLLGAVMHHVLEEKLWAPMKPSPGR